MKLDNYFSTCASLLAFYAAITLDVGQLPSERKRGLIDFVQSPPIPLMWRVALNRGSQENHLVQIEKNLISVCLGNVIALLRRSPLKKWGRNMGRKGYWRHVGFSWALRWPEHWHGATWQKSREMSSEVAGRVGTFTFSLRHTPRFCGVLSLYLLSGKLLWTRLKVCSHSQQIHSFLSKEFSLCSDQ